MTMEIKTANWVEVDLDAIEYNFNGIKNKLPKNVNMCMVIKSNAYGHGAVEMAKFYEELGADFLAVARPREGMELRKNGVELPILNLGYTNPLAMSDSIENEISMTVFDYDTAALINEYAKELGITAKVHIKLDTGMSRLGFLISESTLGYVIDEIRKINDLKFVEIEGIFTHFATSDCRNKEYENLQMDKFSTTVDYLAKMNIKPKYLHCSNSAEILDTDERYNMVRPGIIQYGIYPSDEVQYSIDLRPAMSFKAKVSNVKLLKPGISISYGRTYFTTVTEKIVSIAVGYADGFLRGRRHPYVYIQGIKCPVVGRICMDQCMVRVPMEMDVNINDDAIIFGGDEVSVLTIAEECDTIDHEILCRIDRRVPRVYKRHGEIIKITDYLLD